MAADLPGHPGGGEPGDQEHRGIEEVDRQGEDGRVRFGGGEPTEDPGGQCHVLGRRNGAGQEGEDRAQPQRRENDQQEKDQVTGETRDRYGPRKVLPVNARIPSAGNNDSIPTFITQTPIGTDRVRRIAPFTYANMNAS